jgi:hypothetical protein
VTRTNKSQYLRDIIMDNGLVTSFMEEANFFLMMAPTSRALLKKELLTDKEGIFIIMDVFTKVI